MAVNGTWNPSTIEVIVGTMFSGKSKELIERGIRAQEYGNSEVSYFKPAIDTRDTNIKSRNGLKAEAVLIEKGKDILKYLNGLPQNSRSVVIIDEAQFFDESLLYSVQILKQRGYNVVVGGLDKDYRGQPFGIMPHLMALSDVHIRKMYSVCAIEGCVEDGSYPQRLRNGKPDSALSPTVIIEGSSDDITYMPVCKEHHSVPDIDSYISKKLENCS